MGIKNIAFKMTIEHINNLKEKEIKIVIGKSHELFGEAIT